MFGRPLFALFVALTLTALTQACGDAGNGSYQAPPLDLDGSAGDSATPGDTGGGMPDASTLGDAAPLTCDPAQRLCSHEFTWPGAMSQPDVAEVRGTFNGWVAGSLPMTLSGGVWKATGLLPMGQNVEYKFWASWSTSRCGIAPCETWFTDPGNPMTSAAGNSVLQNVTCTSYTCPGAGPALTLVGKPVIGASSYSFQVRYVPGGAELDQAKTVVTLNGAATTVPYDASKHIFTVSVPSGAAANKYGYLFKVKDTGGAASTLYVPFWLEATPFVWKDSFMYEVMTDRFFAGGTSKLGPNGAPTDPAGDWKGGDFGGITAKINGGYFDAMGVNTLWISSPVLETTLCENGAGGNNGHCLSAYHSYFPLATGWVDGSENDPLFTSHGVTNPIDPHFGTAADLTALVNAAHTHGIRVLTDLVVNHVFGDASPQAPQAPQLAPLWVAHGTDTSWFNIPYGGSKNDCGGQNLWDVATTSNPNRTNCWFDPYLPDFNTANAHVNDVVADHAVWLMEQFNLDGFRVDAAKQVMNNVCVQLRTKVNAAISTQIPFYMVGEALGGDVDFVMDCVGAGMLDGSMNDPLHNTIVGTILNNDGNAGNDLDNGVLYDEATWTGRYAGAVMGHFFGSHDVPRAISIAAGNVGDSWNSPPPAQETNGSAFSRLGLAQAFLMTYDSIPILWMGDEFGMPGSFDPDNRRMMRFDASLNAQEKATLANFQKLGKVRKAHSSLRRGDRTRLWVDAQYYAYVRKDGADTAIAVFNFDPVNPQTRTIAVAGLGLSGTLTDALSGGTATVSGTNTLAITLPPLTAAVYTK